eukprot:jgi/Tetstr1/425821/TSEL_016199.t1
MRLARASGRAGKRRGRLCPGRQDQLIEEVVEGLLNDVDASNQEGEECDHEKAYAYISSEAEDSGDDEDELYFSPLPTRNPRRDTLHGHAYFVDDAMSDDEMEPRRGKGSSGRLWAGHEKATSEHTFETWKNSTDCAMEKEQQQAFDRNRPFNEIHEVHVLRSRIQPKYLESLETTLISRGIKYEDSRIVRRLEGAERLDYYRRLLDGMWEELVNITKQIELHSERYNKCHRLPGETVRDFRNLLLTHTRVKNLVTEETTRIVKISRVNVEFIERAWGKTRFSPRINFAQQQLVDYTMDTQVDRTWEMAEWLDKQERGSIHMRAHSRVQIGGGRRGFDHEEHNSRDIREQALRLPKGSVTRRCLEQQAEVANKVIFALQPTGAEAKEQPETARLDTITCELHANNTLLQCETISDGGSSHTRMNASAMEPSAAEAVVKGAGGWVDVDMVVVLANGKRSCEQQRRLRDGVVFTLRDPVTSIMAAHHAPRVYENGGEAPGLLLGGPTITALGLRPDPATRICTFRAPNRPAGRVPLLSQTAWERRVREHQPVVRVERASYCHGVELGDDEMGEESGWPDTGIRTSTRQPARPLGSVFKELSMSIANRNALGLRDRRSRLLFHVAAFIEKLEEKQPTGVGWLLENVDTSGDERLYIKESEKYITKIIGRALVIDEACCGANHHRVRRFWTNMGDVERLKLAWERRADMQPRLLREVLPPHLRPHVNLPTPPNGVRVNKPGQPRALPTILARSDSDAYSGEGAGMLFNINTGEWERPTVHLKEELFGYDPNVIHGISLPDHERLIGNAMGLHSVAWIVGQLFVEQQRLRDLEELERAARAAQAAQRAERERRDQRRMQRPCGRAWQQLCQQALCCWLLLIWLGGTSMHFSEASRLGNTTVLAMFVAVMVRASARYRREVTATSRAGRRAFGANAVSDGGGTAGRSSAAAWANRGYTQASMNDHVEDVRSLKDPEKHGRCGRECEASQQRQLLELCDSFWDDVWVWSVSDLPAVNHWALYSISL